MFRWTICTFVAAMVKEVILSLLCEYFEIAIIRREALYDWLYCMFVLLATTTSTTETY